MPVDAIAELQETDDDDDDNSVIERIVKKVTVTQMTQTKTQVSTSYPFGKCGTAAVVVIRTAIKV